MASPSVAEVIWGGAAKRQLLVSGARAGSEGGMVQFLLGGIIVVFMVLLALGAITGRVKARSCCSIADPNQDRRMAETPPS